MADVTRRDDVAGHAPLRPVERIDVLTLQDNFIDLAAMDSTPVVRRALPIKDGQIRNSIGAEHGFSALVTIADGSAERSVLFDFGFSARGALANADALDVDLGRVEAFVLSHGHLDHHGGLAAFIERRGGTPIDLILHPAALRKARCFKVAADTRFALPPVSEATIGCAGVRVIKTTAPRPLLDDTLLFLGEIPKRTAFERGSVRMHYQEDGEEKWDPIEDDSAIVGHVRGKGLVVLSGCAHAGIVNTVNYAREVTGVDEICVVMGGFHLTGAEFEPIIGATAQALGAMHPRYIVPTHCTGRKATMEIERLMPDQFLLNMSGTKMVFAA